MATVIDTLIVTLGLDASGLRKGIGDSQKEVENLRKGVQKSGQTADETNKKWTKAEKEKADLLRKQHELQTKQSKEQLEQTKKLASGLNDVKGQIIGVIAAFTGGKGLVDWITGTINLNAQIGRTSALLGTSAQVLSNWQGAATTLQGTAEGATQALQAMANISYQLATTGQSPALGLMRLYGIDQKVLDNPSEALLKIGDAVQRLKGEGRPIADITRDLAGFGITDIGVATTLEKGGTRELLRAMEEAHKVTPQQVADAEAQAEAWAKVQRQWTDVATQLSESLMPYIQQFVGWLNQVVAWAKANPTTVKEIFIGITAAVFALAAAVAAFAVAAQPELMGVAAAAFAIGGGLAYAAQNAKDGKSAFDFSSTIPGVNRLGDAFKAIQKATAGWAKTLSDLLLGGVLEGLGKGIEAFLQKPLNAAADLVALLADGLASIIDALSKNWTQYAIDAAKFTADAARLAALGVTGQDNQGGGGGAPAPGGGPPITVGETAGVPGKANQAIRYAAATFMRGGMPANSALALAGMLYGESGLNPTQYNPAGGHYGARGIAQLRGPRVDAYRARYGHDVLQGSEDEQLDFVLWELKQNAQLGGSALMKGGKISDLMALVGWQTEGGQDQRSIPGILGDFGRAARGLGDPSLEGQARASAQAAGWWTGAGVAPGVASRSKSVNVQSTTNIQTMNINVPSGQPDQIAAGMHESIQRSSSLQSIVAGLL